MHYLRGQAREITSKTKGKEESGFGPVELWVMGPPRIERVVTCYAIRTQGLSENCLLAMSATRSVPRARDAENHFLFSLRRGGPIGKVLVHRWSPESHQQS